MDTTPRKRGRPRNEEQEALSQIVAVRLYPELLERLDTYVAKLQRELRVYSTTATRAQAIRLLLEQHLPDLPSTTSPDAPEPLTLARNVPAPLVTSPEITEPVSPLAAIPHPTPQKQLSPIRQQIMDCLRDHPEGLTTRQLQELLGTTANLRPTTGRMEKDGLLIHQTNGVYVIKNQ